MTENKVRLLADFYIRAKNGWVISHNEFDRIEVTNTNFNLIDYCGNSISQFIAFTLEECSIVRAELYTGDNESIKLNPIQAFNDVFVIGHQLVE